MIKTLIFDFDGTIADCKQLHQHAFRTAITQVCPGVDYDDALVEGRPTREKIRILHTLGFNFNGDKLNEIKQAITQERLSEFITYDQDLYDQFKRLSARYKLCLATNATEFFINRSLEIMNIKQFFVKINTATDFPAKPDPITFLDCMRHTGSSPSTTIIFEDSEVGIQCARATGASVVEVANVKDTLEKMKDF